LRKPIIVLLVLGLVTTQFAFADGNDSPAECLGGATDETGGPTNIDVGAGNIISGICIKSGNEAFNNWKHSGLIIADGTVGDGDIPDDCYTIMGLVTQTVTITETGNSACKEISHVDYVVEPWDMVGGYGGITENTALLVSGSHLTASWMIPLLVSAIGIGIFVFTRK
jgi:hypothetical protein